MSHELLLRITIDLLFPFALGLLWIGIKRQFDKRDAKDDKIAELLEERERLKEGAIYEWRNKFDGTLCSVKNRLDEIADDLHRKVPFDVCEKKEAEVRRQVEDHDRRMRAGGL